MSFQLPEFLNGNALEAAPVLLNYDLCVKDADGNTERRLITEVEAYHGFEDRASHAHKGKTPRNDVMFGPPGHWYVYLCYGVHWLLNLVTGPEDYPSAILIRGVAGEKSDGPGKLTKTLGIDKRFDGQACSPEAGLWIEPVNDVLRIEKKQIETSSRIGVAYAGEHWANVEWRFHRKSFR